MKVEVGGVKTVMVAEVVLTLTQDEALMLAEHLEAQQTGNDLGDEVWDFGEDLLERIGEAMREAGMPW